MHDAVFKCDLSAPYKLKSDVFSLILPFFALDGKATNEAIIYYKELYLEINTINPAIGRATIKDKAILVFCLSQLMVKLNYSYETGNIASFTAYDFLTTCLVPKTDIFYLDEYTVLFCLTIKQSRFK